MQVFKSVGNFFKDSNLINKISCFPEIFFLLVIYANICCELPWVLTFEANLLV